MKLRLGLLAFALGAAGCFNFDKAYDVFCAGGKCGVDAGAGGGGATGGGGGSSVGGGSGGGAGGGSDGGADAGTDAGTDAGIDAGPCLHFGETCKTPTACCTVSDAGLAMGCSRLDYCQPTPAACLEDGYRCSSDSQCCTGSCENGRCRVCGDDGEPCSSARHCCSLVGFNESVCNTAASSCDSSGPSAANGYRCLSSDFCASGFCDRPDASVPEGLCADAGTTCTPLLGSPGAPCCPGTQLAMGVCKLPDNAFCSSYGNPCASGNCTGGLCTVATRAKIGERCYDSNTCAGLAPLCDPVSRTCTQQWCIPVGKPMPGCCSWTTWPGSCVFADAGYCLLPGTGCTTNNECCGGLCQLDTSGSKSCSGVQFF
jgi:hypothetical protein